MNPLAENFRSERLPSPTTDVAVATCLVASESLVEEEDALGQEEKCEDNPGCTSDISPDNGSYPEIDEIFPDTQLLVQDDLTAASISSHTAQSPTKMQMSPSKSNNLPAKVRSSPAKSQLSPGNLRSSPIKIESPARIRSHPELHSSPVKASVDPSPVLDDTPEEFRAEGAEGKFTKVFPAISKLVESSGWQIAQGMNTLFCAMPGVQFFNFKPNINVFDSKMKACWKFIEIAGKKTGDQEDQELWNLLWPIAEKEFKWFTMNCGSEMWFVKPETKFENFLPNETVFQSKRRAVLKCLAVEVGSIDLGESAEGHQIVSFAPHTVQSKPLPVVKKAKASLFKTPSPAIKSSQRSTPASNSKAEFVTPAKQAPAPMSSSSAKRKSTSSVTSSISGAKRKLSSSASKVTKNSGTNKKVKAGKAGTKKSVPKKTKKVISDTASDVSKADDFNFVAPEFRCTFGILYAKLQDEGWYHRSGVFEYDYFSPTYTDATKEQNVNYFRSQADLEDFLKVSGTWKRIEDELRLEHELVVEEERGKALEKYHQRLEQQATRKRNIALYGQPVKEKTKKPKKSFNKASDASSGQCLYNAEAEATSPEKNDEELPKLKFGTVLKKLIGRGWYYRPGRFEYDYFKPSANPKTAVSGEDRFESASALEIYLKTTGLWEQIAVEVAHEKAAKRGHESPELSNSRSKLESPHLSLDSSQKMTSNGAPEEENVNAITNDIWANSHEFEFNE
ncbi:hypothetical protein Plhal304r1_c078g0164551 [Plasmopara halstedii]